MGGIVSKTTGRPVLSGRPRENVAQIEEPARRRGAARTRRALALRTSGGCKHCVAFPVENVAVVEIFRLICEFVQTAPSKQNPAPQIALSIQSAGLTQCGEKQKDRLEKGGLSTSLIGAGDQATVSAAPLLRRR
jgi:hypothetical protein